MQFKLTDAQYAELESKINLTGEEDYAVLVTKRHNKASYGVHVFARQPSTKEMVAYEEAVSRVKYKGTRAEVEGSAIKAGKALYDVLIARAYDVQVGRQNYPELTRAEAIRVVTDISKREAVREFLGNVSGLTALSEDEGTSEQADGLVSEA